MTSSEPRAKALEALYTADLRNLARPPMEGLSGRARRYVEGVWSFQGEIDRRLDRAALHWEVGRMAAVDRAILRLASYELLYMDTPPAVVLNEAIDLAKRYSTADSGAFINGVLATLLEPESA